MKKRNLRVLFCSSEVFPFAKTGGLADVSGALPQALEQLGCVVKVALPKYRQLRKQGKSLRMGKAIEVCLIENNQYFDREGLYGNEKGDYPDNLERFTFFCKQTLNLMKQINFQPDIIHCHDWQSALIPVYLKTALYNDPFFNQAKSIITIHNLAYQGLFPKEQFPVTGLSERLFNMHQLEFYGKLNLLKGGLIFSDAITTVSPTYAREIQTEEFGCGLQGVLRQRQQSLSGIINGVDYAIWNPERDKKLLKRYHKNRLNNKLVNKIRLQKELGLKPDKDVPLLGLVGRLSAQKGIEVIIGALNKMAAMDLQLVILGTGDEKYHILLREIINKGYENISINLLFDETLAHQIYAASDMFLMPSNYEPCGLGQLISLRYGAIPVVSHTGGLADTISNYDSINETGNGFVLRNNTSEELLASLKSALQVYYTDKPRWLRLVHKAMEYDFSWGASAEKYTQLYQAALDEK